MKKKLYMGIVVGLVTISSAFVSGQAVPTASRGGVAQLGLGWSVVRSDYNHSTTQGLSIYGTFDIFRHIGVEGSIHRASMVTPDNIGLDSYLIGPRFVLPYRRFNPYAKALFGFGRFKYIDPNGTAAFSYKISSYGGGVDYTLNRYVNIRAFDFEYQRWPEVFANPVNNPLRPLVFTFGAAYSFR